MILSFSERPLKFAIGLGTSLSLLSLALAIWVVLRSMFFGYSVTGWASIISAILFSTGILLVVIGISAIYIGEIFREVKNRPLYIIDQKT